MPTSYRIDPSRHLVTCEAWGTLTSAEVVGHYRELRADPEFNPAFQQLADLRSVTEITATPSQIREAALMPVFRPGTKRAFVAESDAHFGVARMFGMYSELQDQVVTVFRDMETAMQWLGLP